MEGMTTANVCCRNALNDTEPFWVLPDQVKSFFVGGIYFQEWFVWVLLILDSCNLVPHRILLSKSLQSCFGGIGIAGAWYILPSEMSSEDIFMPGAVGRTNHSLKK